MKWILFHFRGRIRPAFLGLIRPLSGLDGFQMLLVKRTKESEHKQEFEKKGILRRSLIGI
jgi:hypothetical protein